MRTRTQLGALGQRRLGEMADWRGLTVLGIDWAAPEPERWETDHERGIMFRGRKAGMALQLAEPGTLDLDTLWPLLGPPYQVEGEWRAAYAHGRSVRLTEEQAEGLKLERYLRAIGYDAVKYRKLPGNEMSLNDAVARGILTKEGARAFKGCDTVAVSGSDGSEER